MWCGRKFYLIKSWKCVSSVCWLFVTSQMFWKWETIPNTGLKETKSATYKWNPQKSSNHYFHVVANSPVFVFCQHFDPSIDLLKSYMQWRSQLLHIFQYYNNISMNYYLLTSYNNLYCNFLRKHNFSGSVLSQKKYIRHG